MKENRTTKSLRNSFISLISQIITVLLSFITRTIFIHTLGNAYLGINGLFSNILSVLSFAELGVGTAITYAMYKPLAEKDEKKISAYNNLYALIYRIIGTSVLIFGICLIPFLDFFIGDKSSIPLGLPRLEIIYMLYVVNSAITYFFNYKRSLVIASQNGYIDSINQLVFLIIRNVIQIIVLVFYSSFLLYLITQIIISILSNIFISFKANKLFPFLKNNRQEKLKKHELNQIFKNTGAMIFHKLGAVIVSGTDNILITKFVGLEATGIYSNYVLIQTTIKNIYNQILDPITASVGNMIVTENKEISYKFFKRILFFNAYISIFFTTMLLVLSNFFIEILWGNNSILSDTVVLIIMINFFINCNRKTSQIYIDTIGLFWPIRWKSLIEAFLNLALSIYLGYYCSLGIIGITLGTIISNVLLNFWWEPYVVYRYYFKKSLVLYFREYIIFIIVFVFACIPLYMYSRSIEVNFWNFVVLTFISLLYCNVILNICFLKKDEYKYYRNLIFSILKRRNK